MQNILLPINYEAPFDLLKDSNFNSYILDIGYKSHIVLEKYTLSLNNTKYALHNEDAKTRFDEMLEETIVHYESKIKQLQNNYKKTSIELQEEINNNEKEMKSIKKNYNEDLEKLSSSIFF